MGDRYIPPVTVLMPAYNAGAYIKEAVDSVLAQTFADFEMLIVNDGSTDNTRDILGTYTDPRVRIVDQKNMGLIDTLNKAIALIESPYIARFDADDVCYPERLQLQYDFLRTHAEYVLVGSEADYMDEEGNFIFLFQFKNYEDGEIRSDAFRHCPVIHSSVMFAKEAVVKAGGYSRKAVTFEDHLLWRNLAAFGKMKNMPLPLIKVRFNPDSVTIDEKWRGEEFIALKQRSIASGEVSNSDYDLLLSILKKQNFGAYKKAAYHSMLGKKFLWNQYDPGQARKHLSIAISTMPYKSEPYLLYLFSFLPESLIKNVYKKIKK